MRRAPLTHPPDIRRCRTSLTITSIYERIAGISRSSGPQMPARARVEVFMFSLQRFLGKEDKFFDLLEASAAEACTSVRALITFIKKPDEVKSLDEFIRARRNEKKITSQISEELCTTFVTALEREDIEALSVALYKVPKTIEKIGERILLAPQYMRGVDLAGNCA